MAKNQKSHRYFDKVYKIFMTLHFKLGIKGVK